MVRVLALADEEVPGIVPRLRDLEVDVVLSAGDLPWDHLELVADAVGVPSARVPGNHDPRSEPGRPRGWIDVDGRVADVGGLRVAGLGGCVRYRPGPHQHTQDDFRRAADRVLADAGSAGIDVLLAHAPPAGLGDDPDDPAHLGIEVLHDLVRALSPQWLLHGHLHPYGLNKPDRHLGATTIRNVIPTSLLDVSPRGGAGPSGQEA